MSFDLTPELEASHRRLSKAQSRFLEFAARHPESASREAFADLDRRDELRTRLVQSWPLFLSRERLAEMSAACVGIIDLVKSIPRRVFDNDPARLAEYYAMPAERAEMIAQVIDKTECLEGAIGRGDFLDGAGGFQCCELNMSGNLGGSEMAAWFERYLAVPLIRRFLDETGIEASATHPFRALFRYVIERRARRLPDEHVNMAIIFQDHPGGLWEEFVRFEYWAALDELELSGNLLLCEDPELSYDGNRLRLDGDPVHIVLDTQLGVVGPPVFVAVIEGAIDIYNGPLTQLLSDKRNLALLSEQAESELFTAEERRLIRDHVPWTRKVAAEFADYGEERVYVPDHLLDERERMVLKPALGLRGEDVHVGRSTEEPAWEDLVDRALEEGGWIAQEYVEPLPYLFQDGEAGIVPHDLVWGLFAFGGRYGGGFLRLMPTGGPGVINHALGASEAILFEVDD